MTSGTEWQDPFLVKPDQPVRIGRPIYAPPPMGPRFDGPPVSGYSSPRTGAVDPSAYAFNAPTGYSTQPFSRTWKVTFKRWGRGWLAFLALGIPFGMVLGSMYPSHQLSEDLYTTSYYLGTFWGVGIGYLLFFGWWLDHVLAQAGFRVSLGVQALVAGAIGLVGGSNSETRGDPIDFPLWYLALFGALAIGLAHLAGKKVEGSFAPSEEASYSPPPI